MNKKSLLFIMIVAGLSICGCNEKNNVEIPEIKDKPTEVVEIIEEEDKDDSINAADEEDKKSADNENDKKGFDEKEIIDTGRKISKELSLFEYHVIEKTDWTGQYKFTPYEKGVLAACSIKDKEIYNGKSKDEFAVVYKVPEDEYNKAIGLYLGENVDTEQLNDKADLEEMIKVYVNPDGDGFLLSNYEGETETDLNLLKEEADEIKIDGTVYYTYKKIFFYGYWNEDVKDANYELEYTLSKDANSEYGYLIKDVKASYIGEGEAHEYNPFEDGFYGIWVGEFKSREEADARANDLRQMHIEAEVVVTSEWENLSTETNYAVCATWFSTKKAADTNLPSYQAIYPEAYVKFTGKKKR